MKWKQMADLNRRVATSSVILGILAFLIIFSAHLWIGVILALCVAVMAGIGVWEYLQLARAKGTQLGAYLMIGVAVCEVLSFFISLRFLNWPLLPLIVLTFGMVIFFIFHFRDSSHALTNIAIEFFGICYIAVPLSFMLGILYPSSHHLVSQDGRWWLVYLILVTKMTDIGAYFIGRLWGKHPLAPTLSPKKTVEGGYCGICLRCGDECRIGCFRTCFFGWGF